MNVFIKAMTTALLVIIVLASAGIAIPPNVKISSPSNLVQNEEQVIINPADSNIVICDWRDFRYGYRRVGFGWSSDGGASWSDSMISDSYLLRPYQSDPVMAATNDGTIYMCFMDYWRFSDGSGTIYDSSLFSILKTNDNGATWQGPYTVQPLPGHTWLDDKQFMTVDRSRSEHEGNVYIAWARFPNPNSIMFARSTNGGVSFDPIITITPPQEKVPPCTEGIFDAGQFAQPLADFDGSVYVFHTGWSQIVPSDECEYQGGIKMAKSTDGGVSFTESIVIQEAFGNWLSIDGGIAVYNQPSSAADVTDGPFSGNIYIAYGAANLDNPNYDFDIQFIKSTNGGEDWTEPIYISDDPVTATAIHDQFHPWMVCNQEGVLVCIFYDQRTDPSAYLFDVFAAYSFDGGESFTVNHRISDVSINPDHLDPTKTWPRTIQQTNPREMIPQSPVAEVEARKIRAGLIGEYIGVDAYNDNIVAVWTDTRDLTQCVYGAKWTMPILPPRLIAPNDGDTIAILDPLTWATAWKHNDDRYQVEIATDELFADIVYSTTTDTTFEITGSGLIPDQDYFWRVKASKISDMTETDYSETRKFTIPAAPYVCGDANADTNIDLLDILYLIDNIYGDPPGPEPEPWDSGDVNSDGNLDLLDILYLIDYIYGQPQGPAPDCTS